MIILLHSLKVLSSKPFSKPAKKAILYYSHYIKPIARVYTRECHENKTTRFWATYDYTKNVTVAVRS